jgi:hypothetical protein
MPVNVSSDPVPVSTHSLQLLYTCPVNEGCAARSWLETNSAKFVCSWSLCSFRGGRGASGVIDKALKQIREQKAELRIGMQSDSPTAVKPAVRQNYGRRYGLR